MTDTYRDAGLGIFACTPLDAYEKSLARRYKITVPDSEGEDGQDYARARRDIRAALKAAGLYTGGSDEAPEPDDEYRCPDGCPDPGGRHYHCGRCHGPKPTGMYGHYVYGRFTCEEKA